MQPAIKKKKEGKGEEKRRKEKRKEKEREFRMIDIMLENMFLIEITHLESETGKKLVRFLLYGEFTQPFVCYIDCSLKGIVEVPFSTSHHQGYFRPMFMCNHAHGSLRDPSGPVPFTHARYALPLLRSPLRVSSPI